MGVLGGLILKPTSAPIPTAGLVAEYLANNNFLDTSGNGYNGINNNVTFGTDRHSNANSAFVLNGTSAFVDIDAALAGLSTTTQGTISVWVKATAEVPGATNQIISFGATTANEFIFNQQNPGGQARVGIRRNGTNDLFLDTTNPAFSSAVWVNYIFVQDGGTTPTIYIDNVALAQSYIIDNDRSTWFNTLPLIDNGRIGSDNIASLGELDFFNGSLDDIRIYNRALTTSERQQLVDE